MYVGFYIVALVPMLVGIEILVETEDGLWPMRENPKFCLTLIVIINRVSL